MVGRTVSFVALLLDAGASVASACPDCDVGRIARHQFWNDHFARNLLAGLAPFLVVIAATWIAERVGRPRSSSAE
jgi:hypothetical protein